MLSEITMLSLMTSCFLLGAAVTEVVTGGKAEAIGFCTWGAEAIGNKLVAGLLQEVGAGVVPVLVGDLSSVEVVRRIRGLKEGPLKAEGFFCSLPYGVVDWAGA